METFVVDKSFYDIGSADDLKLWESDDLDPVSRHLHNSVRLVFIINTEFLGPREK